jgi:hypothetical protein
VFVKANKFGKFSTCHTFQHNISRLFSNGRKFSRQHNSAVFVHNFSLFLSHKEKNKLIVLEALLFIAPKKGEENKLKTK